MRSIPILTTSRLTLRGPSASDFSVYSSFYGDAEASRFYGGPLDAAQAWRRLAQDIGHWTLRGHGMWVMVEQASGSTIGGCGIVHPEGWPRHELSWWVVPTARRLGYAEEASRAAIRWALNDLGWSAVETHMKDENVPARALAVKLGGRLVGRQPFPDGILRDVFAFDASGYSAC
jgi:RimJ/RimL family protein N-acetyltransferase